MPPAEFSKNDIPKAELGQLAKLADLLKPYRKQIAIALTALVIAASSFLVLGQGLKAVIDQGVVTGAPAALNQAMLFFLVVVLVLAVATYVRFYFVSWLGERVIADLRKQVFEHLLTLSPSFYENTRTGEALSRLTNDTTMLETVIGSSLSMALRNALMLIGGLVMLAGFLLMIGGKSADPNVFNKDEVYSFRRITLATLLIIGGLIIEIYAIMKKPKE